MKMSMKMSVKKAEEFAEKVNFKKLGGLVPTIAQDSETGRVLMLAFMNKEALVATLTTGYMAYYSRSRRSLWKKGESSGCTQEVIGFSVDCDSDSLLFLVKQKGVACHTGAESCFSKINVPGFGLERLFAIICERKRKPKIGSYTCKLLSDEKLMLKKIGEESAEFIIAVRDEKKKEIVWEACDLLYHALVLLAAKGITPAEIREEFARRAKP